MRRRFVGPSNQNRQEMNEHPSMDQNRMRHQFSAQSMRRQHSNNGGRSETAINQATRRALQNGQILRGHERHSIEDMVP